MQPFLFDCTNVPGCSRLARCSPLLSGLVCFGEHLQERPVVGGCLDPSVGVVMDRRAFIASIAALLSTPQIAEERVYVVFAPLGEVGADI